MEWSEEKLKHIVEEQRIFFRTGKTLDISWRLEQLRKLKRMVEEHEKELEDAMAVDLGRTPEEAYFCDIGDVISE